MKFNFFILPLFFLAINSVASESSDISKPVSRVVYSRNKRLNEERSSSEVTNKKKRRKMDVSLRSFHRPNTARGRRPEEKKKRKRVPKQKKRARRDNKLIHSQDGESLDRSEKDKRFLERLARSGINI